MEAASRGHVACMRSLLDNPPYSQHTSLSSPGGARMAEDGVDKHGKSALIWASYMGQV